MNCLRISIFFLISNFQILPQYGELGEGVVCGFDDESSCFRGVVEIKRDSD